MIEFFLDELFRNIPVDVVAPAVIPPAAVTGITSDSRKVVPGSIFVATLGGNIDAHRFIPAAVKQGASAVVGTEEVSEINVPYIQVSDSRAAYAHLAAALCGFPARQLTVIGVTGTDGKTTTSNMLFKILLQAGIWAGVISTVSAVIGSEILDTGFHVTTPEAPDIQRYLQRMVASGLTHVVLESTSHGLAQHRVTGCEFDIAVVTNITHEHLDYHGSYEAYRAAKGQLFRSLADTAPKAHGNPRLAVLNADDSSYEYLKSITAVQCVSYSQSPGQVDYWAEDIYHDAAGLHFTAAGRGFRVPVHCPIVGRYNVSNALAAIAAAVSGLGIDPERAASGIARLESIPGRMERINMGQGFLAIVDFAHTPNALKEALLFAKELAEERVICVFGSAGLRDRMKRRLMAEISERLADFTILTAEDPRTESLDLILAEMAESAAQAGGVEGQTFIRVPDRGEAILKAVEMAAPGDVVIACGKGHEQSMCFGEVEYAWDDRQAMRASLARYLRVTGPPMPYLPTQDG